MKRNPRYPLLLLALGICLGDQLTKYVILDHFQHGGAVMDALSFASWQHAFGLRFILAFNRGISFSLFSTDSVLYYHIMTGIICALLVFILGWLWRETDRRIQICLALILGGGLGNVVDRFLRGAVVDFIDVYWQPFHWPTFNVADIFVSVSALSLFVVTLRTGRQKDGRRAPKKGGL